MNLLEKVKELRNRISIPMKKAIELLKKNNGDILLCETEFRNMNIAEICDRTMCGEELVRKTYKECGFDTEKTIVCLSSRGRTISTRNINERTPKREIGYSLSPSRYGEKWWLTPASECVFISADDFDYIYDIVNSIFPITDPETQEKSYSIYPCGDNRISKKAWETIIDKLETKHFEEQKVDKFVKDVICWVKEKLENADEIVLDGNL